MTWSWYFSMSLPVSAILNSVPSIRVSNFSLFCWINNVFWERIFWSFSRPLILPIWLFSFFWRKASLCSLSRCWLLPSSTFFSKVSKAFSACSKATLSTFIFSSMDLYCVLRLLILIQCNSKLICLYSALISKYFLALFACFSRVLTWPSISKRRSSTRARSSSVCLNLERVSFLRNLYLDTPAACSKRRKRLLSLSAKRSSTMPRAMIA